jgi:energy-coupling factor transporter ATP-binding protein EcfA2
MAEQISESVTASKPPEAALRLAGVTVRYPGRREPSLVEMDLMVEAGECVGVTGRTGAGKSTLALVAGGFLPRVVRATVTGRAAVDGIDATTTDAGALLGHVGIVFATPANQLSASKQTVREELAFGLENLGVSRPVMEERISDVLARLGIDHLAEREPFTLSGGEQQRVAIASIVIMGTRLLVLDEPTAQLDPAGTDDVGALMGELAREGTAIVVVEQDPSILGRLDRIVLLEGGHLAGSGDPGHVLGSAVAGSLGLPPPTLVRLAEVAGLDSAMAFDEKAIVAGLRALRGGFDIAPSQPSPSVAWDEGLGRSTSVLEVQDVTHRYPNGVEALRGVSLRFTPGEAVAIVGQNGSGKTTLVKHFNGLLRPDRGDVRIDGRSTKRDRVDQLAATVGFVFQNPDDQLFERTVEREASFGPRNLGQDATTIRRRVDWSLEAVGLTEVAATNPYDLDLSRRKLVSLAAVLAMNPAILVLDEPTTGQDPLGSARVGAVVRRMRDAGRAVIAITHDMEFAANHFDRVVIMRQGTVIADGLPSELLAVANQGLLGTTGLTPPPAARIAAALGFAVVPANAMALVEMLTNRSSGILPT